MIQIICDSSDTSSIKFTKEQLMDMAITQCATREAVFEKILEVKQNHIEQQRKHIAVMREALENIAHGGQFNPDIQPGFELREIALDALKKIASNRDE